MRTLRLAVLFSLIAAPALAQEKGGAERIDLFGPGSRRTGHAIIDREAGRVDFYDVRSRRTGYGKIRDGRVERFDLRSRRTGRHETR